MITLHPIQTVEQVAALQAAAAADGGHGVLYPSHLVQKAGEIVGYGSVFATPLCNVWMHRAKTNARDTLAGLKFIDEQARQLGIRSWLMACSKESPYFAHMPRLGYEPIWDTVLHQRILTD